MSEETNAEALKALQGIFKDRFRRYPTGEPRAEEGALGYVLPVDAEEVEQLASTAQRYSLPLVAQGGGTVGEAGSEKGAVLVRFDLMRDTRLPENDEGWAEAEPGALWLTLDNELSARDRGLAVYPTSAPRATIGGWLATDGLGVGSFEYGWLTENVLSASVVLPGGERREIPGRDLRVVFGPEGTSGIAVGAKLRTRDAASDTPFAAAFATADGVTGAVKDLAASGAPLWHLAFLNPNLVRLRKLGEGYLLFGAFPGARAATVEASLPPVVKRHGGRLLPAAEAHRVWGERFFPVAPSRPSPNPTREFVTVEEIPATLSEAEDRSPHAAVQGTVARSGDVLLLSFEAKEA